METGQQPNTFFNLANNSDDDITVASTPLIAKQFYASQVHSFKALIILCDGMKDESGAPLVDYSSTMVFHAEERCYEAYYE